MNNFSFEFPSGWNLKKFKNQPYVTQLTNAERDYITENKGAISITYYNTSEEFNIDTFRIATKGKSKTLSDKEIIVNNFNAYENSYNHPLAYEKTITVELSPKNYLQISLATAKNNASYYVNILDDILNSLEVVE